MKTIKIFNYNFRHFFIGVGFFIIILLGSCISKNPSLPTQNPENPTTTLKQLLTSTNTKTPTRTATLAPTQTLTSILPTSTFTPTATPTSLPWSQEELTIENILDIQMLNNWGRGEINNVRESSMGYSIVSTTIGVFIYQSQSMELLAEFPDAIRFILSPNQRLVALLYIDGTVCIIDLDNQQLKYELEPLSGIPEVMCPGCDAITKQRTLSYFVPGTIIKFSPDSSLLAVGYVDNTIGIWNMEDGSLSVDLYHDATGFCDGVIFSDDMTQILTSGFSFYTYPRQKFVAKWSLESGELFWYQSVTGYFSQELFSENGKIFGLSFSPAGGNYSLARLYNYENGSVIGEINGKISQHPYNPDQNLFVSTNSNNILIWQLEPSFILLRTLYPQVEFEIDEARFSPDGKQLWVNNGQLIYQIPEYTIIQDTIPVSPEPTKMVYQDFQKYKDLQHFDIPTAYLTNENDEMFIYGENEQELWIVNLFDWTKKTINISSNRIGNLVLNPEGIAAACSTEQITFYSLNENTPSPFDRCLESDFITLSSTGTMIARTRNNQIQLFDWSTGEQIQNYVTQGYPLSWAEFSPDGMMIAGGGELCGRTCLGDLQLWQISPAKGIPLTSDGSGWPVTDVDFSVDHELLFAAKKAVWGWNTKTGQSIGKFSENGTKLAVSPNKQLLAIGTNEGIIKIVSISDRKEILQFQAHPQLILSLSFNKNGTNIISMGKEGVIKIWGIDS